jgi:hypothetical protein
VGLIYVAVPKKAFEMEVMSVVSARAAVGAPDHAHAIASATAMKLFAHIAAAHTPSPRWVKNVGLAMSLTRPLYLGLWPNWCAAAIDKAGT